MYQLKEHLNQSMEYTTTTGTMSQPCSHKTGWYRTIHFKFLGFITLRKEIFCCSDCGDILQDEKLKKFKNDS